MSYFKKAQCQVLVDELVPIADFIYQHSLDYISAREGAYNILTHSYAALDWPIIDFNTTWSNISNRFESFVSVGRYVVTDITHNERHGTCIIIKPCLSMPWHFTLPMHWLSDGLLKPYLYIASSEMTRLRKKMVTLNGN